MPMARHAPWPAPSSWKRRDHLVRERRRAHRRIKQIVEAGRADVGRYANAAGAKAAQTPRPNSCNAKWRCVVPAGRLIDSREKKYKAVGGSRLDASIA